jgi:NACalpha-BTF3-like transcription factor
MNLCLSVCIPEEIWVMIAQKHGLTFKSLFLVNKNMHSYMGKIKNQFIKYKTTYCYFSGNKTIRFMKYDDNICNIKYNSVKFNIDMNFYSEVHFQQSLNILIIHIDKHARYAIHENKLYDMDKYIHRDMDNYITIIRDQTYCDKHKAKFALGYCDYDIVEAILFITKN